MNRGHHMLSAEKKLFELTLEMELTWPTQSGERSQKGELTRWEGAACGLDCLLAAHLPTNEDIADGWTR